MSDLWGYQQMNSGPFSVRFRLHNFIFSFLTRCAFINASVFRAMLQRPFSSCSGFQTTNLAFPRFLFIHFLLSSLYNRSVTYKSISTFLQDLTSSTFDLTIFIKIAHTHHLSPVQYTQAHWSGSDRTLALSQGVNFPVKQYWKTNSEELIRWVPPGSSDFP